MKIIIVIEGGAVQSVVKPKGMELEIRDFDVDGVDVTHDRERFRKDKSGHCYQRMFWGKDVSEQ